jgi:hypothetical protein
MRSLLLLVLLAASACSSSPAKRDGSLPPVDHAADWLPPADLRPDRSPVDSSPGCTLNATECVDSSTQRVCRGSGGVATWVTETCPAGQRCWEKACSAECHDQCDLGTTRTVSGKLEECRLYSVQKDAPVAPGSGLHDRARAHNAWLRAHHLASGSVSDIRFADAKHTKAAAYEGVGDSAIWTGTYLAAEALRLKVTRDPDAEANVEKLVEIVHRLFAVTGFPGFLARYTAPVSSGDPLIDALYEPQNPNHHKVTYQGKDYFWLGSTSRDQYQGPMLGYALAFEALSSTAHKQIIRDDMIPVCTELMKERKAVPVTVEFYVNGQWVQLPLSFDMQYVIMNPSEFKNGGPYIRVGGSSDPTDLQSSELNGVREFIPDWQTLLKQTPLIGGLIPSIPRAGSAVMLAAIFRVCQLVTKGDPTQAAFYATVKDFYDKHVDDWIKVMKQFNVLPPQPCWPSYYGHNINYEPAYNLLRLEDDPFRWSTIQQEVEAAQMWPEIADHKNVFFAFIHASQAPQSTERQTVISTHAAQLAQFPPPPHALVAVDNSAKYAANPSCPGQSSGAVDVGTRVAEDFIWQRHPFTLKTSGEPEKVFPGADYLIAYWLGRRHGFLDEDAAGTCLRWGPTSP